MRLGEYTLVTFEGAEALSVKRKAVAYWYDHRNDLALGLKEFLERCLPINDGTSTVTFSPAHLPQDNSSKQQRQ